MRHGTVSIYTVSIYRVSIYIVSNLTVSIYIVSIQSVFTASIYTVSIHSQYSQSVFTASIYTVSIYTVSIHSQYLHPLEMARVSHNCPEDLMAGNITAIIFIAMIITILVVLVKYNYIYFILNSCDKEPQTCFMD